MLLYAIFGFLACYSKFVTTVMTELAGRSLALKFNPNECCSFLFYA